MSIEERCSCGARFKTDEEGALQLVREWRRKHVCAVLERDSEVTSGFAQVENQIGFRAEGLVLPAKEYDPWGDE